MILTFLGKIAQRNLESIPFLPGKLLGYGSEKEQSYRPAPTYEPARRWQRGGGMAQITNWGLVGLLLGYYAIWLSGPEQWAPMSAPAQ